ncbi:MAG: zinc ABC transporter substrate-binding protein [Sulfuricurvum sp.]|nr:zinc ABC transporter substrate-binding protein [Sulfuricurvum sp.]
MEKKKIILFTVVLAAFVMIIFSFAPQSHKEQGNRAEAPIVYVSTFSLYESARAVAGEGMDVRIIIPLGSDAHMFSPNPTQVAAISNATLFVYNGAGFETWAENFKNTLPQSTRTLDMSKKVVLMKGGHHHFEADDEDGEDAYDPHYWLNIDNMIKMTQVLEGEFAKINPAQADAFHNNAATYIHELEKLKGEFLSGLAECRNRTLVSNHDAFGYLSASNNLEEVSVIGLSSDEQPSAKNIADIIAVVKKHGVKTIFFEEFINDNVSQTIARETGTKAQSLQPLENISEDELKSHQTYLSIMRENLNKLREAMECR